MGHVLIVEDTAELLELMAITLRSQGYRVSTTQDGEHALAMALADAPDLVLLDVVMPRVSGFEVATQLREHPDTADIPIIFVTARAQTDDLVHGLEVAVDYISKPFAVPELIARVRAALRIQSLQTQLRTKNEQLEHLSVTDPLTGLLNRRGFEQAFEAEIHRARRQSEPLGLALFDLDHFKAVNDDYSHAQGDLALRHFADILRSCSRRSDASARPGGEEFALLLPFSDLSGTRTVCEKVRQTLADSSIGLVGEWAGTSLSITVSVGAIVAPIETIFEGEPMLLLAALLDAADRNLYTAKGAGRNRVEVTTFHGVDSLQTA